MSKEIVVELTHILYASPSKVFETLTNPDLIQKWSGGSAVVELKKGGALELFDGWVKGEIIDFNPGRLLVFTWKPSEWKPKTNPSIVDYRLTKHEAGTMLKVTHSGFPDQKEADNHKNGWIDFVFDPLNDFFTSV